MAKRDSIKVRGAAQNNLQSVDVHIPRGTLTVVTGVSGSGKSSLAFDTIYAEGQRRYLETFSTYARQFIQKLDAPDVTEIIAIPPAIAIGGTGPVRTSRSTVGTMTGITDHVKLLFSNWAELFCRGCGRHVASSSPEDVAAFLPQNLEPGLPFVVCFRRDIPAALPPAVARAAIVKQGFSRILRDGSILDIEEQETGIPDSLDILVDRISNRPGENPRIVEAVELAYRYGQGTVLVYPGDDSEPLIFSDRPHCPYCDILYEPPLQNLFSFNDPIGACPVCHGFGRIIEIDPDLVIPDRRLSLAEGAVRPWQSGMSRGCQADLLDYCYFAGIPVDKPFDELTDKQQQSVVDGADTFYGVKGYFDWLESKSYKMHVRVLLSRYRTYRICTACGGGRFRKESLLYRFNEQTIAGIYGFTVDSAHDFFSRVVQEARQSHSRDEALLLILSETLTRINYLRRVGLGYLTLDRQSRTLSGGETERVALTAALGTRLVNTLYVLDEPSTGLHPRDTERLGAVLRELKNRGNTVLLVEHDAHLIALADHVIDMGPGPGAAGGRLVYSGAPEHLAGTPGSITAAYATGKKQVFLGENRRGEPDKWLTVLSPTRHNLKGETIRIPLERAVCLTGVSGSGKSTLMIDVLHTALKRSLAGGPPMADGGGGELEGAGQISHVELVDQRAVGKTPRSNPGTYLKILNPLRNIFAASPEAEKRGYKPGHFSFNSVLGKCPSCKGAGYDRIEMQFLPDLLLRCPVCDGKRLKQDVLSISWHGHSFSDILGFSVKEIMELFQDYPAVLRRCRPLVDVGLDYLTLGQPLPTLSGGEVQRLKLAAALARFPRKNGVMFLFDEPTVGLHPHDINRLLRSLDQLIDTGHSVVLIEHHLDVIRWADHCIDMGPEGGENGGYVVVSGPPDQLAAARHSWTGKYLKRYCEELKTGGGRSPLVQDRNDADSRPEQPETAETIEIKGAAEHNLKNIDVAIPRNRLVAVTGVSGSGKSSLAFDIVFSEGRRRYMESLPLYVRRYVEDLNRPRVASVRGIPPTVAFEQRKTSAAGNSTVGTITEIYHHLRLLFARAGSQTCTWSGRNAPDPRLFSFNSKLGACPDCSGSGMKMDGKRLCPSCRGTRLREEALAVRYNGSSIAELAAMSIGSAHRFFSTVNKTERDEVAASIVPRIIDRLTFLTEVGLPYLTLDRRADTLSTGEMQRVKLAAQLGSNLKGVCYVLDEPTVGLHPRDCRRLIEKLHELRDSGNSVVVVEHDEATIRAADHVIDLGPGAGDHGGSIIAQGTMHDIAAAGESSLTGRFLTRPPAHGRERRRPVDAGTPRLTLHGARKNNLRAISVSFPLQRLICVTGVSGAGKSTLIDEVLLPALKRSDKNLPGDRDLYDSCDGADLIDRAGEVDQTPIGRTPRSVPATYVKAFNEIRRIFASLPEARARGYAAGRFSFNTAPGRCPVCRGLGSVKVAMSFLPDVYAACKTCGGSRFERETLSVRYRGSTIADVLSMTVDEALCHFGSFPRVVRKLKPLEELGLGYLQLGQSSPSLSGGEAQRIKLAAELSLAGGKKKSLLVLEEPTTGLHAADVQRLVDVLHKLVEAGNTVIVIEHNLDVIGAADHIIDLGPEGGENGGTIVAQGTPEDLIGEAVDRSHTARFLAGAVS